MTEHQIKLAIADLQRTLREFCGYAPPREVDLLDYPPEPHGPPEEIGTGVYRMVDGDVAGNEPESPEM